LSAVEEIRGKLAGTPLETRRPPERLSAWQADLRVGRRAGAAVLELRVDPEAITPRETLSSIRSGERLTLATCRNASNLR
jgi:hypothetical protein